MERASVQKTAKVLRVLVLAVFVLNLLCLLLTPGATAYVADGGPGRLFQALQGEVERWMGQGEHFPMGIIFVVSWWAVWSRAETAVLTVFFWLCGVCTAVILWQAKKVLDTILQGSPFQQANARGAEAGGGVLLDHLRGVACAAGVLAVVERDAGPFVYL